MPRTTHPSEHRHIPGAITRARRLRRDMTPAERRLWSELRKLEVNFRRQAPLGRYIVDFVQHESKLIVELDGGQHGESLAEAYDAARTAWLESRGYRVLRFWNADLSDSLQGVVEMILNALSPPPRPSPVKGEGEGARCSTSPSTGEGRGGGATYGEQD